MKVINLFSGPGSGKSTTAAGLFNIMKKAGYNVEYVTEYAKDLVYSKSFFKIKDQLYIFAKQQHPLFKLKNQVDYVIMDSPLPLSLVYLNEETNFNPSAFKDLVLSTFNSYENFNIFLERSSEPFQESGRIHNLEESMLKDKEIRCVLEYYNIDYFSLKIHSNIEQEIFEMIKTGV